MAELRALRIAVALAPVLIAGLGAQDDTRVTAWLSVLDPAGRPVERFTVDVWPTQPSRVRSHFGVERTTRPVAGRLLAELPPLPPGEYALRIHSDRGAMTCSSFRIDADGLVLTVTLGRGVRVTGTIVDSHGNPVPAATIDVVEPPSVGPLVFICSRNPSPTRPWTTADEHGRFALDHVTPGRYCVRVRHPALSERTLPAVSLEADGQALDLGFVELQQGAIFEGTCTVNGRPAGQIKVMIGPPNGYRPEVDSEGRPVTPMFSASAITDGDGTYRFLTRVPPGTYKIHAFKEAGGDDVFSRFQQMKETERQLVVAPGQEQSVQNFNLSN